MTSPSDQYIHPYLPYGKKPSIVEMLDALAGGGCVGIRRPSECVVVDFDIDPSANNIRKLAGPIEKFRQFLCDFYFTDFFVVGAENRCVRVFFRPAPFSLSKSEIRGRVEHNVFRKQMRALKIDRVFMYGTTLTAQQTAE